MKNYIKLIRPYHWIKNLIMFVPLGFSGQLFNARQFLPTVVGFIAFCLIASSVYLMNDIQDRDKDRQHPTKKNRPIASGAVSVSSAIIYLSILLILGFGLSLLTSLFVGNWALALWPLGYFVINLGYSNGLKNVPLIDVAIIAVGFLMRLLFGAGISDVTVSSWLFLTVLSASFFLGFGKRRNEITKSGSKSRTVLNAYSYNFLDKIMYVFLGLTIGFYSMWTINGLNASASHLMIWSVPLVMIIVADYSLIVEGDSDGDPAEVLRHSKTLSILVIAYVLLMLVLLYFV